MPSKFDSNEDKNKNSDNVKYNGGIDGRSKKWEEYHKTKNTKSGTGELGRQQTLPGEVTDTTKMTPDEKYRYMKALGMVQSTNNNTKTSNRPVRKSTVEPKKLLPVDKQLVDYYGPDRAKVLSDLVGTNPAAMKAFELGSEMGSRDWNDISQEDPQNVSGTEQDFEYKSALEYLAKTGFKSGV